MTEYIGPLNEKILSKIEVRDTIIGYGRTEWIVLSNIFVGDIQEIIIQTDGRLSEIILFHKYFGFVSPMTMRPINE